MKEELIINETEKLLEILESISENESTIKYQLQNKKKVLYFLFSFLIIIFLPSLYLVTQIQYLYRDVFLQVMIFALFSTFLILNAILLKLNIDSRKNLIHKLEMEIDIKHRIISIIHDQISRMEINEMLNPILRATIEIRLRRATSYF